MAFAQIRRPAPARRGTHPVLVTSAAGTVTANTTTTHDIVCAPGKKYNIAAVYASCSTVAADADGTVLATLKKYDASANQAVTLSSALDLEGLTAHEGTAFTFSAAVDTASRLMDSGDVLYVEIVSNSAAIDTAAANLRFTAELMALE